jgi:hypothetical protein
MIRRAAVISRRSELLSRLSGTALHQPLKDEISRFLQCCEKPPASANVEPLAFHEM